MHRKWLYHLYILHYHRLERNWLSEIIGIGFLPLRALCCCNGSMVATKSCNEVLFAYMPFFVSILHNFQWPLMAQFGGDDPMFFWCHQLQRRHMKNNVASCRSHSLHLRSFPMYWGKKKNNILTSLQRMHNTYYNRGSHHPVRRRFRSGSCRWELVQNIAVLLIHHRLAESLKNNHDESITTPTRLPLGSLIVCIILL